MSAVAVVMVAASSWLAQAAPVATPPEAQAQAAPAPPAEPAPEPAWQPPPPPPPPPEPLRYGHAGMSELSLALGYSSSAGFVGGGGFRRFVLDGVAPGVEGSVQTGAGLTVGLVLGSLRVVPVSAPGFAFVLTARGGRVLLSDHADGWGAGGGAGIIWFVAPNAGLELGYDVLWLLPKSFCTDLSSCTIQGPVLGLRFAF
jgi:hypothetical protein